MGTAFGMLLFEARAHAKLTLRKLSALVNRSVSYLSELENGDKIVPLDQDFFSKIASTLELNPEEVIAAANEDQLRRKAPKKVSEKLGGDLTLALCRTVEEKEEENDLDEFRKQLLDWLNTQRRNREK